MGPSGSIQHLPAPEPGRGKLQGMTTQDAVAAAKETAGRHAAAMVRDGMRVGLGTGSTVHFTIVALGEAVADGLEITCTATSARTDELARSLGITVVSPDEVRRLDIAIDGADEVDPQLNLIKGGGGAHLREKVVAEMAQRFVVVVDENKLVDRLGPFGVPLEVADFAPGVMAERLRALGARDVTFREERSDNGNLLADAHFVEIEDPVALAASIAAVPGVLEHGIFLGSTVERVVVATADGSTREITH